MNILELVKKNIKWKITMIFVIMMVCCLGSILLFNTLFLEKLYINQRKRMLVKIHDIIDEGINNAFDKGYTLDDMFKQSRYYIPRNDGKNDDTKKERVRISEKNSETSFIRMLRNLQNIYNISVVFVDDNNEKYSIFYNTYRYENRINDYIFDTNNKNEKVFKILEKNPTYTIAIYSGNSTYNNSYRDKKNVYDPNDDLHRGPGAVDVNFQERLSKEMEFFGFLSDNETQFYMSVPIMSISEPIKIFNKIMIYVLLVIILLEALIIYVTSNQISKPIVELSNVSKKMAKMDFNTKCKITREDEIGTLGKNMNEMSDKLEKNIQELKNANIRLKADLIQKEKLDNMRTEFIANVSHELKTPIALIEGYAEGLEGDIVTNKEDRDFYVQVIKEEADKMSKMVKQLLDLMEIEKGVDEVNIERVKLKEIVDGVLRAQEINTVELKVDNLVDDSLFVWTDSFKLEEVITNYMTNAIHHVDENKYIKLWTEILEEDTVRLYVYNTANSLTDEQLENLWEKFYKVDKARTREYGGTGLGLSIVKAIAEKLGTKCGCNNMEKGVVFYFDMYIK